MEREEEVRIMAVLVARLKVQLVTMTEEEETMFKALVGKNSNLEDAISTSLLIITNPLPPVNDISENFTATPNNIINKI